MPRRGLTTEAVVDAAIELADADGLEGLTLARLAARLKVQPPSLFNHIHGLPGLLRLMQLRGLAEMSDRALRAGVGRSGDRAVMAISQALRAFSHEHPGLYAASLPSTPPDDPELSEAAERFARVLFDAMRRYGLRGARAVHAVRGLFSAVHGFIMLERAGTFGLPVSTDASFRWLIRRYTLSLAHGRRRKSGQRHAAAAQR
jgi:AcrR family transcriptional regulator